MKWALVTTIDRTIGSWVLVEIGTDFLGNPLYENQWQDVNFSTGSIVNIIAYDGVSPYTPSDGYVLKEVDNDKRIGDYVGI